MGIDKRIAVGSDHAAVEAKDKLIKHLQDNGYEVVDYTVVVDGKADYPTAGHKVAAAVAKGEFQRGLLMCGTGLGMSYTANRHPGVRAALCLDTEFARLSRDHNDANILVMPGRVKAYAPLTEILDTWLATPFSGDERHINRIRQIELPDARACE
ncbi:MAG: RpiB/LacA/LacB family sugar-phosphate isomerase [Planctomycetes bacterium]|nr:RpiB/LacA/LacB family sugar-phosphate isomerase [Planctomycetota bacterium]